MPYYFGYLSKVERTTPTAVSIGDETYEPAEPSRIKIFPLVSAFSIITSLWTSMFALLVAALSYEKGTVIAFSEEGEPCGRVEERLPLRKVGLAFTLRKGITLDQSLEEDLSSRGFSTMAFNRTTLYFKDHAEKADYEWVEENVDGIDERKPVPNRFLGLQAFRTILILWNLTSAICSAMHQSAVGVASDLRGKGQSILDHTYAKFPRKQDDETMEEEEGEVSEDDGEVKKGHSGNKDGKPGSSTWVKYLQSVFISSPADELGYWMPAAVINPFDSKDRREAFITAGDTSKVTSHGMIMKFHPGLAMPDPNLIGDILGKYFMRLLGTDQEEQHAMLCEIKRGVAALRLTRLGDELVHLYKCIEIALEARCGMVPFFTGNSYEGSILMGGEGCVLSWPGEDRILVFQEMESLRKEFKTVSTHTTALHNIANKFSEMTAVAVMGCSSMRDLRALCLAEKLSSDDMEYIVGQASFLLFETVPHWVVNPANVKKAMSIIAGTLPVTGDLPLTRHTLFSKDLVLVGLSVFGEKSVPSWNVPAGTLKSLRGNIPSIPNSQNQEYGKSSKAGIISDLDWTMVIRRTDLMTAVDDFREMVRRGSYRTSSSALARKQGYLAYGPKQMIEFWTEMQGAYRRVDPNFVPNAGEVTISREVAKKRARDSKDSAQNRALKKMKF